MKKILIQINIAACLQLLLVACSQGDTIHLPQATRLQPSTILPNDTPLATPTDVIITGTMPSPISSDAPHPAAQALIQQSKTHLAKKLGLGLNEIFLFSVGAVDWPDASLGCPQAGVNYAQGITPGYRIVLEANGQSFTFHTDETNRVILCNVRAPDEIFLPP